MYTYIKLKCVYTYIYIYILRCCKECIDMSVSAHIVWHQGAERKKSGGDPRHVQSTEGQGQGQGQGTRKEHGKEKGKEKEPEGEAPSPQETLPPPQSLVR